MYWKYQPELPRDKGSNRPRGATHDIGSGPFNVSLGPNVEVYVLTCYILTLAWC